MNRESILEKVKKVISRQCRVKEDEISEKSTLESLGINYVLAIDLLDAVYRELDISVDDDSAPSNTIETVEDLVDHVCSIIGEESDG
ncbi:MAG: phosphopantetheine-binding protein [Patescibacteria group bacterium]|nr:phosphopantetheine-binding protein [Patescibacteria group bacterium]